MSTHSEEILHHAVDRREALQMDRRLEAPHLALTLTRRLVRDFRPVVRVLIRAVDHRRHHRTARRRVTAELVGDQSARDTALPFQQFPKEPYRGTTIPARLHQDVEHVAVFIHRAPEILLAAVERDEELVEIPRVSLLTAPPPERAGVVPAECQAPRRRGAKVYQLRRDSFLTRGCSRRPFKQSDSRERAR